MNRNFLWRWGKNMQKPSPPPRSRWANELSERHLLYLVKASNRVTNEQMNWWINSSSLEVHCTGLSRRVHVWTFIPEMIVCADDDGDDELSSPIQAHLWICSAHTVIAAGTAHSDASERDLYVIDYIDFMNIICLAIRSEGLLRTICLSGSVRQLNEFDNCQ